MLRVLKVNLRWRNVVGLAPLVDLLIAVEISHGLFVRALEGPIMAFIDPPVLYHVYLSSGAHFLKDKVSCLGCSFKH